MGDDKLRPRKAGALVDHEVIGAAHGSLWRTVPVCACRAYGMRRAHTASGQAKGAGGPKAWGLGATHNAAANGPTPPGAEPCRHRTHCAHRLHACHANRRKSRVTTQTLQNAPT